MSNRIPINNFGTPIQSKTKGGLSKLKADHLYLNVSGEDSMASDLNMGGYQISNVDTPEATTDAANKAYVDRLNAVISQKIAALTARIFELTQAHDLLVKTNYVDNKVATLAGRLDAFALEHVDFTKKAYVEAQIQSITPVFKRYPFKIVSNRSKMVANFNNLHMIGNLIIQSVWFKISPDSWINGCGVDDVKYMITFQNHSLYFYCKKIHPKFTGDCELIVQTLE